MFTAPFTYFHTYFSSIALYSLSSQNRTHIYSHFLQISKRSFLIIINKIQNLVPQRIRQGFWTQKRRGWARIDKHWHNKLMLLGLGFDSHERAIRTDRVREDTRTIRNHIDLATRVRAAHADRVARCHAVASIELVRLKHVRLFAGSRRVVLSFRRAISVSMLCILAKRRSPLVRRHLRRIDIRVGEFSNTYLGDAPASHSRSN